MIQVLAVAEQMKYCVFCKRYSAVIFCTGGPVHPTDIACYPNIFYEGCSFYSLEQVTVGVYIRMYVLHMYK